MSKEEGVLKLKEMQGSWPIPMLPGLGLALVFYSALPNGIETISEYIGFFFCIAMGLFFGWRWGREQYRKVAEIKEATGMTDQEVRLYWKV